VSDDSSKPPAQPEDVDRRRFLHRLSGEAVSTAGRIAGFSAAVRRSVVAAGEAAAQEIGPRAEPSGDAPPPPPELPTAPARREIAVTAPPARTSPPPALTADQEALLARARSATLAVNDAAGAPHVTASWFAWDGEAFRLPAGLFTAKANHVARDPQVSLLIEEPSAGGWVAVTGIAETLAGPRAADEALLLLAKYRPGDEPAAAWAELYPAGDAAVIIVRPTRFVWRTG
jgi:nitroimidazol reductase NimA-like FMN-containing flavoprotein (pyridoxamine 5'-phosphate oxidase superfamily)